jgi:hypothetical protein
MLLNEAGKFDMEVVSILIGFKPFCFNRTAQFADVKI